MNITKTKFSKNGQMKSTATKTVPKKEGTTENKLQSSQLMKLFHDGLKDIYWAEKALTKAIPKMVKNATSEKLIEALTSHLLETENQITRLEQVFKLLDKKAVGAKCEAMAGLIKESEEIMDDCKPGAMRDAGIIAGGQKIEHYEIASYGTLSQFAQTLGLKEVVKLLDETLKEEKAADVKLTEVAVATINIDASEKKA
ncbi:ferritin-like domain-containing protein [Flavobacterium azooxidireducens]|uniref:Ferritin-like domain-containing protein n=1 Tax=Flavobacterium azooxidireducens TaxID=1871076 RepID=A0ABY4KG67_9FLAO|nr:ferritin-like domain-containing protein [Flavobacterium azooxidireducens]UPQ79794.1 ferritin-like domain-containing protein [Flavobacterium azooxidireducens]